MRAPRGIAALACAVVLACGLVVPGAAPARADDTGSLSVSLTAWADGSVATAGCVRVYSTESTVVASQCANVSGTFSIGGLAAGEYRLKFTDLGSFAPDQWFDRADNYASAVPVAVAAGSTSPIAYALLPAMSISGKVTGPDDLPIAGVTVTRDQGAPSPRSAVTGSDGRYVIPGPDNGSLNRVHFDPPAGYAQESWNDGPFAAGDYVTMSATSMRTGIDAKITAGGTMTGTIKAPPGLLTDGIGCLLIFNWQDYTGLAAKRCGTEGSPFTVEHLHPGTYALCVTDDNAANGCGQYVPGWYGDSYHSGTTDSKAVTVVDGDVTTVSLAFGGTVAVSTQLDNGAALEGGCLSSADLAPFGAVTDCSPVNGVFTFHLTRDFRGSAWFSLTGAGNAKNIIYAKPGSLPLAINAGDTTAISLPVSSTGSSTIAVTLARADAAAITGGCVDAVLVVGSTEVVKGSDCTLTADPVASFTGLPAGDYLVRARDVPGSYAKVTYPAAVNSAPADPVHVGAGETANLSLTLPTTQTVTGTVRDAASNPVAGAVVDLRSAATVYATAITDTDGTYSITAPVVDAAAFVHGASGYGHRWSGNSQQYSSASRVAGPTRNATVSAVNFTVGPEARAQGVIAIPSNKTWTRACVSFLDATIALVYGTQCGNVGESFDIGHLATGSYRVCVAEEGSSGVCGASGSGGVITGNGYGSQSLASGTNAIQILFGGIVRVVPNAGGAAPDYACARLLAGSSVLATSCNITGGHIDLAVGYDLSASSYMVEVYDVDGYVDASRWGLQVGLGKTVDTSFALSEWPAITGTITRPAGFENTHVCAFATDLVTVFEEVCLDPGQNSYSLQAPPGKYWLLFHSEEPGPAAEWFDNKPTLAGATLVNVGTYYADIANATLAVGGAIAGTITLADGTLATSGCATAYAGDGYGVATDCSLESGSYRLDGLPADTYRVEFTDVPLHAVRWYGGQVTFADATGIRVSAGALVTANQTLARAALLQGTVTRDGGPAQGGCVEVVTLGGDTVTSGCANSSGEYAIGDVPAGTYKVLFVGFDGAGDLWSGGSATFAHASAITVSAGVTRLLDFALDAGGSISGFTFSSASTNDFTAYLYTVDGSLVKSTSLVHDEYSGDYNFTFENVPAGAYKVSVQHGDASYERFYRKPPEIAPAVISMPSGSSWDVQGLSIYGFGNAEDEAGSLVGRLNVPSTWGSATVCAVALSSGIPMNSDCGPRGGRFVLDNLQAGSAYSIVFVNGVVRTSAQYKAFKGAKTYYGNTTAIATAPTYTVWSGESSYLPVWFYHDVTPKTSAFEKIQWMGDQGLYTSPSYYPTKAMTRATFAVYLYKLAGSPKVTLPSKSPFKDVKVGAPGYTAMVWMYQKKYWTASTFAPSGNVTRATAAVWLYRLAGSPAVTLPSKSPYTDVKKSTTVTYKAIVWAKSKRLMGAASGTSFKSTSSFSRAAGAVYLYNYWWYVG